MSALSTQKTGSIESMNLSGGGFYSDLVSQVLSESCQDRINELMGSRCVGFLSVSLLNYHEIVNQCGTGMGFLILQTLKKEMPVQFERVFAECEIAAVEAAGVDRFMICFHADKKLKLKTGELAELYRFRLSEIINGGFLQNTPVTIKTGWASISAPKESGFYESIFRAYCEAESAGEGSEAASASALDKEFNDIIEKKRIACLYQPVVDLRSGEIVGWEAFIRGPEKSCFHTPLALFTHAREIGKIFYLDQKCREAAIKNLGPIAPGRLLFMNIHMQSLNDPEFTPGLTMQMSRECGLSPENIVLEFSESHGIKDYTLLLKNLKHYRSQGFKVAIDNFGQSTLRFISQIKPDYIKMDASLIRGISYNPLRKAMVEGIAALSGKIGASIIASELETQSEARTLAGIGVHFGQGYFLARPAFPKQADPSDLGSDISFSGPSLKKSETPVRDLIQPFVQTAPGTPISEVKRLLKDQPHMCSIVIAEEKKPLGLLMSHQLDRQLGTQYGVSLFYRRCISLLMDPEPLVFEADQPLGEAAKAAMNRDASKIYDDIIVTEDGEILGTVSVQKMLDNLSRIEILARENAEAATEAKSRFLASMSHYIRTPMNAILGMADLLWESPLDSEQKKFVSVFRNAGESLLHLINDILDLSKVEAGQIELEIIDFNLPEIVETTCEVLALKCHKRKVELLYEISPDVPPDLKGDPTRLRQMISNLIGNAVKFTKRGEIVLSIRPDSRPAPEDGNIRLHFAVRDTGIGIPPDKQDAVFETFAQAHSSTSREFGGTGLGLSICKRFAEMMGGEIWVESEVGRGSTFRFIAEFALQEKSCTIPVGIDLDGTRILIIEENRTAARILKQTLVLWGADVTVEENAEEGMGCIRTANERETPFQAVIIDSRLKGNNGFETAEAVKNRFQMQGRTIMLISSEHLSRDRERGRAIGVACHLVKPVKYADLADALQRVLGMAGGRMKADSRGAALAASAADMPPMKILLAEDNENNRILFSFYLKSTHHQVDMVDNGKRCLKKYTSGSYDIIFMDINMPVMDGYKATTLIREWEAENKRAAVPIIALTAHALKGQRQESLDAGCNEHMTKPFKKEAIFDILCRYAGPETFFPEMCFLEEGGVMLVQTGEEETPAASEPLGEGDASGSSKVEVVINPELQELIPGFLEITREEMVKLDGAISDEDYKIIGRMGHRIKGAALCYGFMDMGDMALKIEDAGKSEEDLGLISRLRDDLRSYLEHVTVRFG